MISHTIDCAFCAIINKNTRKEKNCSAPSNANYQKHSNSSHTIMITISCNNINDLSQESYDDIISQIDISTLQCPSCDHSACMIKHGRYERTVRLPKATVTLRILRVKCMHCSATHALLLVQIVPYSQIPRNCQMEMIRCKSSREETLLNEMYNYAPSDLNYVKKQYSMYWKTRISSRHIYFTAAISKRCFELFGLQFMQIRKTPNRMYCLKTT